MNITLSVDEQVVQRAREAAQKAARGARPAEAAAQCTAAKRGRDFQRQPYELGASALTFAALELSPRRT